MATIVTRSGKGSPLTNTEVDSNFTNLNTDKIEDAPSDGNQYARQSGAWAAVSAAATVVTSSTAPSSPSDGDVWYSESNGVTYVYYDDGTSSQWVATGAPTGSLGGFSNLSEMSDVAITSVQDKDILVYDSGTSKWINEAPVIEQWESGTLTFGASTNSVVSSGWARQTNINGAMTQTSGVFTFPSTGHWLVRADFSFYGTSSSNRTAAILGGSIEKTTDGSTYSNLTGNSFADRSHQTSSSNTAEHNSTATLSFVFDVTSTSTHKIRLRAKSDSNAASSDKLDVHVLFQRLGAT
jgi:hypothetical protein